MAGRSVAGSFDRQVVDMMGGFFDDPSLPTMKSLVQVGPSYDEVMRLVKLPTTWG